MKEYRYRVEPTEIDGQHLEAVDLRRELDVLPSDEPRALYALREYVQEVPQLEREADGTAILMLWLPRQQRAIIQDGESAFRVDADGPDDAVGRWLESGPA